MPLVRRSQLSSFVVAAHDSRHCACDAEPQLMKVCAGPRRKVCESSHEGEQQV